MSKRPFDKELFKRSVIYNVKTLYRQTIEEASPPHIFKAVALATKDAIIDGGYDPIYGARPLKRYIQSHVETMLAKQIIGGANQAGDTITVDAENGNLVLR